MADGNGNGSKLLGWPAAFISTLALALLLAKASGLETAAEHDADMATIRREQADYHAAQKADHDREMKRIACLLEAINERKFRACQ